MKNLSDVDVLLMTHLGDNMRGALLLEEDWSRVSDFYLPRAKQSPLTHQPKFQDLTVPPHILYEVVIYVHTDRSHVDYAAITRYFHWKQMLFWDNSLISQSIETVMELFPFSDYTQNK